MPVKTKASKGLKKRAHQRVHALSVSDESVIWLAKDHGEGSGWGNTIARKAPQQEDAQAPGG